MLTLRRSRARDRPPAHGLSFLPVTPRELNELFQRGIAVKVLDGIAAGEHTERSLVLDLALALAEDRRRDISRKAKDGLDAARRRGRVAGPPWSTTTSTARSSLGAPKAKASEPLQLAPR